MEWVVRSEKEYVRGRRGEGVNPIFVGALL